MAEEQKNQNINFNKNNRFKERHPILSTLEYSNIGKVNKKGKKVKSRKGEKVFALQLFHPIAFSFFQFIFD